MIFPILFCDTKVQVNEVIRFDVSQSKGEFASVKFLVGSEEVLIPDSSHLHRDIHLDWIFTSAQDVTVRAIFKDSEDNEVYAEKTISVVTQGTEKLFNTDSDLLAYESEVRSWVPNGRSTWNFVHREVKKVILEEISAKFGTRVTDDQILSIVQFREWAKFKALEMIFRSINNTESDVFSSKAEFYRKEAGNYRTLAYNHLEIDFNKDGSIDDKKEAKNGNLSIMVVR